MVGASGGPGQAVTCTTHNERAFNDQYTCRTECIVQDEHMCSMGVGTSLRRKDTSGGPGQTVYNTNKIYYIQLYSVSCTIPWHCDVNVI